MPHFTVETEHAPRSVCGVDEAGCGPWAGPVVAAAVMFRSAADAPMGLNDSKKLTPAKREALFDAIMQQAVASAVALATVEEIDPHNIWGATQLAMRRAVESLRIAPALALIDGKRTPKPFPCAVQTIIGGDGISLSIAAASILAKVTRDRIMKAYAETYPHYGFERHAGYGTAVHQQAIADHGLCPIHRRSFKPIRAYADAQAEAKNEAA